MALLQQMTDLGNYNSIHMKENVIVLYEMYIKSEQQCNVYENDKAFLIFSLQLSGFKVHVKIYAGRCHN